MRPFVVKRSNDRDDELKAELKQTSLRVTPTRLWVLRVLASADKPLSHADLVAQLPWEVERTTVFRALIALTEAGLLRRVDIGDRIWRYTREVAPASSFVCTECGSITEIAIPPRTVHDAAVRIVVHGRCDKCA
ncbi:MAG: transcriptional repressor [Kofleriaceae bacterium]